MFPDPSDGVYSSSFINNMYIAVQLPFVSPFKLSDGQTLDKIKKFAWVKKIGYALIKEIDIEKG